MKINFSIISEDFIRLGTFSIHPVIVPIKMTVLKSVALIVVALYWRIVQLLKNEISFHKVNCFVYSRGMYYL